MENLKIRVNSADESKEIQNILESKGFKKWAGWSELGSIGGFIWTDSDMTYCDNEIRYFNESPREEITLPELRAMANREQDEPFLTPECTLNDQYAEIHGTVKAEPDLNFGAAQASGGVDATLAERQSTYGNFEDVAFVTENIMHILAKVRVNGLDDLPNTHRMALYMIASKMARIVNGDFNHLDSWHDIGGYAKLIEKLIKGE